MPDKCKICLYRGEDKMHSGLLAEVLWQTQMLPLAELRHQLVVSMRVLRGAEQTTRSPRTTFTLSALRCHSTAVLSAFSSRLYA